ncbi:hypothetical protein FG386_003526 [Cryptosporidium ryanae]|uniref:uncharacterized protein n=1 Tax=Cryptosporidium ryanae TaxID=515981 RepID=UPI003519E20A|nr:hypothetical protein FG386_003526 [Cryptosporidium ryanae]
MRGILIVEKVIKVINFFSPIIAIFLTLSLPGLDKQNDVKESGFSEGMNRASVAQNIVYDFKKTTQEILTSQVSSLDTKDKILDFIETEFLRNPFCSECGDSSEIEIIRNKYISESIIPNINGISSEYLLAIVPSKRGYSSESIVISISFPWDNKTKRYELGNIAGVIVSFSKHLTKVNWLSKDVYILFTDANVPYNIGISAFLRDLSSSTKLQRLNSRIRTALCIEMLSSIPTKILIDIESMDGFLPIQDLPIAIIREIDSYYNNPPIYVEPRLFWDSLVRQASNGGSERPHTTFLHNYIQSFTISLIDESSHINGGLIQYFLKNNDESESFPEFISIYPIPNYEIFRFLEGMVKIISNLHDELNRSTYFYYFTSYVSSIDIGVYLSVFLIILLPILIKTLSNIYYKCNFLIIGAIVTTTYYLINYIAFIVLQNYLTKNIKYPSFEYLESDIYFENLIIDLVNKFFLLTSIVNVVFRLSLKLSEKYIKFGKGKIIDAIDSVKSINNIFIIIFSVFISIKYFSLSVITTPILLLFNNIIESRNLIDKAFCTINVACLLFLFKPDLNYLICTITTFYIYLINFISIKTTNILLITSYMNNFDSDIYRARNALSVWNSVMGREFFCGKYSKYLSEDIRIGCNSENFSKIKVISELYKIMKKFPILQWLTWISIFNDKQCIDKRGIGNNISKFVTKFVRDSIYLKSKTFQYFIIGIVPAISLSLSLIQ